MSQLNYYRMVVVTQEEYDAVESPELWEDHVDKDCVVFGLAVNIEEQDNKFRFAYLDNNVSNPNILDEMEAYLAGAMNFARVCGEDIVVVVDTNTAQYNILKLYDLINSGQFYEAFHIEEAGDW